MYETAGPEHLKRHRRTLEAAARKGMVRRLPALHAEAFSRIDCLACARCCSGYSPRFRPPDVRRVARAVGMAVPAFEQKYLTTDEDEDWVAKTAPCPFLQADRCCQVYEDRPTDCARYPYTDSEVLLKRPALTLKNAQICPAVHYVLTRLGEEVG